MRTDELITILSTNVEPVDRGRIVRILGAALAIGAVLAIAAVLLALGIRPDLMRTEAFLYLALKLLFTTLVLAPASFYLVRLARPGGERNTPIAMVALPFVAIVILAAVSFAVTPNTHWSKMVMGDQWLECLLSIPIIAVVPFAAIIWAVRQTAPTDLVRTGAIAGLLAGGLSATGYAFHCADDSLAFIALWYGGTIALCTLAGATLGPRLLRW
jgi:hypothetical protein